MTNNKNFNKSQIGIIGAGTMGRGIAQIAATAGHRVFLVDLNDEILHNAQKSLEKIHNRLVEKGKIDRTKAEDILSNITYSNDLESFHSCAFAIEAVVENLQIKQDVFARLEKIMPENAILATNTSSLSITSVASACDKPERVIGVHFFNPAPLMALVEIVPGMTTSELTINTARSLIDNWGKKTVVAKDTPGFIVNRVARPFYGEALRILE